MPNVRDLALNRPPLFSSTIARGSNGPMQKSTFASSVDTAFGNTSSFRYDPLDVGFKSSQQLNVDWSSFENHTFFNSAQVKVNTTFQKFFDSFPFDGTKTECELFFDKLTGYEKWVFDNLLPKNKGYLYFSGTVGSETNNGTYVEAKDIVGAEYPTLVRSPTGNSVLNPGLDSMTLEFHLFVPPIANTDQIVLQKVSSSFGFGIVLEQTSSIDTCGLQMIVVSGSQILNTPTLEMKKNQFNHVAFVWNRTPDVEKIYGYANSNLLVSSSAQEIGFLGLNGGSFLIGSGSSFGGFVPTNTLSGAMDELRVWHSIRTQNQLQEFSIKNVYAEPTLKLYYKFNEASGSGTQVVLDHSGKGLHGTICSYAANNLQVREVLTSSVAGPSPVLFEKEELCPVLFDSIPSINTTISSLLKKAKVYDEANPNWIVNLLPTHYLEEGQYQDALSTVDGPIVDGLLYGPSSLQGSNLGETQVLLLLLYTWAAFFDELKVCLDAFGNMGFVDYDNTDTTPDQFLQFVAKKFGLTLPSLFSNSTIDQFVAGENVDVSYGINPISLQKIQTQIWRRILVNIKDVIDSKGTLHSVKALIRATGIDPDNNFRIREYGGATKNNLRHSREKRSEVSTMLSFVSGGIVQSPYLIATRVEPGWPSPAGTVNDNLLTSGSWTYESLVKFEKPQQATQSVVRFQTTGSAGEFVSANLLAVSGSGFNLYLRPNISSSAPVLTMSVGTFDPLDGQVWNVSFGKRRGDEQNQLSSSFFLRAARSSFGNIVEEYSSSAFFNDQFPSANVWNEYNVSYNASGSKIVIGSQSLNTHGVLLGSTRPSNFDGKVSQIRFWSLALPHEDWQEHVRNFKSLGVKDPKVNFNFVNNLSGSFGRIRLDASTDQPVTSSLTDGTFDLFDFSQNGFHMSGTNFPFTSSVVVGETFYYSFLSPHFDDSSTTDKVRVRSYQNYDNVLNGESYVATAPLYQLNKSEEPKDSTKFSIDLSVVDSLNQDIVTMFGSLEEFDNALGNPELLFSMDYPSLEHLKSVYFNKLTSKLNLKIMFDFYKWFDTNIGEMIKQLLPRKTKFLGTNYCIESHMLERPKFEYQFEDSYLGSDNRHGPKETITLQFFTGNLGKL